MSSRRFPGIKLREWRSRLPDTYPRLFPDAKPVRDSDGDRIASAGWPLVEDGWREIVESLCERLDAVARHISGQVVVFGLDEKFAEMRIDVACISLSRLEHAEVESVVERAEARSSQTCGVCGARGAIWEHGGWLVARCTVHAEGLANGDAHRNSVRYSFVDMNGRALKIARLYLYDRDTFVAVEPAGGNGAKLK